MNDMNDANDSDTAGDPRQRSVRSALHVTAAGLELDAVEPIDVRRRATRRRRRRGLALAGGTTVLAVGVVGAIVANNDPAEFATTPPTTAPATTVPASDEVTAGSVVPTTTPITAPATLPPIEPAATASDTAVAAAATAPGNGNVQLLPWRDGFLAVGYEYSPQPLPELPDEVTELFPQEVLDLFPDGLPSTIDEATSILSEAGLLDEVSEVVAAHPEVSDAIYATEPPPPELIASFTTDGNDWQRIQMTPPIAPYSQFLIDGDRLVAWSYGHDTPGAAPGDAVPLTLAWTDDLATWSQTTTMLATESRPGDVARTEQFVSSLAVSGTRYAFTVDQHSYIDYEALLPEETRRLLLAGARDWGYRTDESGLTIEYYDGDGTETQSFTWAELGLEVDPSVDIGFEQGHSTVWVGTLGDQPAPVETGLPRAHRQIAALPGGFVLTGFGAAWSPDGTTWTPVEGMPDSFFVNALGRIGDGALLIGSDRNGSTAWRLDTGGSVTSVELPELPARYDLWGPYHASAWIVEVGDHPEPTWEPVTVVVEHEGYEFTVVDGPDGSSVTLVDLASGEVLVDATVDSEESYEDVWEYDDETDTVTAVLRDDAGDEIVRIPGELLTQAYAEAYSGSPEDVDDGIEPEAWMPDLWLLATDDGINWLARDLDDPDPEGGNNWPQSAAVNDGRVLYQTTTGWALETIG